MLALLELLIFLFIAGMVMMLVLRAFGFRAGFVTSLLVLVAFFALLLLVLLFFAVVFGLFSELFMLLAGG